ncbi:hypothetical protein Q7P36_004012 [Cladosporium allicinum]
MGNFIHFARNWSDFLEPNWSNHTIHIESSRARDEKNRPAALKGVVIGCFQGDQANAVDESRAQEEETDRDIAGEKSIDGTPKSPEPEQVIHDTPTSPEPEPYHSYPSPGSVMTEQNNLGR